MPKGISAVITTLLLLVIVIGLVGAAYGYVSGVFKSSTSNIIEISDASCDTVTCLVVLRNLAEQGAVDVSSISIVVGSNTINPSSISWSGASIVAGGTVDAIFPTSSASVPEGVHSIRASSPSSRSLRTSVFIPEASAVLNLPPTIDFVQISPQNPTENDVVTITAGASDDIGLTLIEIFVDGSLAGSCPVSGTSDTCQQDVGPFPAGSTLDYYATATDLDLLSASSVVETFNIQGGGSYTIPTIGGTKPTSVTFGPTVHTVCSSSCTHTNLQSAINDLPADGGKVIIRAGTTLNPSSTVNLRSNLVIEFEAGARINHFSSLGPNKPTIQGVNVNNVQIISPTMSTTQSGVDLIHFLSSDTIIIQDGTLTGVKGGDSATIQLDKTKNVWVNGGTYKTASRPIRAGDFRIPADPDSRNIWIEGVTVSDSSVEGIRCNGSYECHIIGNTVFDTSNNGIDIGSSIGSEVRGNTLTNVGYGSTFNAVGIHTDGANTIVLMNNKIDLSGTDAISICGSDNNYVIGNTLSRTGQQAAFNAGNGVEVIRCGANQEHIPEYTIIDGNHISDTVDTGVYITFTATDVQIINNVIERYGTVAILDNSKKAIISGNTIN